MTAASTPTRPWSAWDRVGAACGAAYVLLILVGNQIAGSGDGGHASGRQALADLSAKPGPVDHLGFALEVTGMLVFLLFLGWFVALLRSRGGAASWLGSAAGYAGTVVLAVKLASVMPLSAGLLDHAQISPTEARVLTDMNAAAFVVTFLPFGVFMLASGLAILTGGVLGRVAGWTAVVIGAAGLLITLASHADPFGSNPMPFLAGLLWLLVVGVRLAVRGPRPARRTPTAAEPAPGLATSL